jgi:protein O-GlcNAc transferase
MSASTSISDSVETARRHHQAGRFREAEQVYRQVLSQRPDQAEALHGLGLLAERAGRADVAMDLFRRAVRIVPSSAAIHNDLGKTLIRAGQLDAAQQCFKKAVELNPDFSEAHNNLGNTLKSQQKFDEATAEFRRSIELNPEYAEAHYNLGNILRDQQKNEEALAEYRRAIELRPGLTEAHNNLGFALYNLERYPEAIESFRKAVSIRSDFASAYNNLGGALRAVGQLAEAVQSVDRAVQLKPDYAAAHNNRGLILKELGRLPEALNAFRRAIQIKPEFPDALNNLASTLSGQGRYHELMELCRWMLSRDPNHAEAYNSMASALQQLCKIDEAAAAVKKSLEINPNLAEAHSNQASIYRDQGKLDESIASYRKAVELKPGSSVIHSNLVYTIHFSPDFDSAQILSENRRWAQMHEEKIPLPSTAYPNDRSPDRILRIGYVSPDFRTHCASCFLKPLLSHHDPKQVEVICYSGVTQADKITEAFKGIAHVWRDATALPDDRLAERIREDQVDILVDVALHMAGTRLPVFARKPAPIQVTWLGYPSTTGLSRIDYRLTDQYLDPPGETDGFYSERSIRLPDSFWCYHPLIETAEVNELPALKNGRITFGCFNHFVKVTQASVELWAEVLRAIADSKLVVLCLEGKHRDEFRGKFEKLGVDPNRLDFVGRAPMPEFFKFFHRADLCLDSIPYPGHTTGLDGLWMGVPAVTLAGATSCARGGVSILTNVGLPELIARTPREYVDLNVKLAGDIPKLAEMRKGLREKLRASPLMDAGRFAKSVEAAYRQMWKNWCAS